MIICDKCKNGNSDREAIIGDRTYHDKVGTVTFSFDRFVEAGDKSYPRHHDLTLDLCPKCQEEFIKSILGYLPWVD